MRLPEPMRRRYDNLEQSLRTVAQGKTIYYVANPGNWGDGLIRAGTLKFFADRDIRVIEHPYKTYRKPAWLRAPGWLRAVDRNNSVLLFGGGGGWCDYWDVSAYIRAMARHFRSIVVLPSTLQIDCSDIPALFFCRDDEPSQQKNPDAIFCDDMAFCLEPPLSEMVATREVGFFIRTDEESVVSGKLPEQNRDISLEGSHMTDPDEFFAVVADFATVHTDRLHVAIAATLLGREVHLYPGSYFKNQSVYSSSLRNNFPGVCFHPEPFGS